MARKKSEAEKVQVAVYLTRDVIARLDALAQAQNRTRSNYIYTVLVRAIGQGAAAEIDNQNQQ